MNAIHTQTPFSGKLFLIFTLSLLQGYLLLGSQTFLQKRSSQAIDPGTTNDTASFSSTGDAQNICEFSSPEREKKRRCASTQEAGSRHILLSRCKKFLEKLGIVMDGSDLIVSRHAPLPNEKVQVSESSSALVNLWYEYADGVSNRVSQHVAGFSQINVINDDLDEGVEIGPTYKDLIEKKKFGGLLKMLHLEAQLFMIPFKQVLKVLNSLEKRIEPFSLKEIENLIEAIRNCLSYQTSLQEIAAVYSFLTTNRMNIESTCQALSMSIAYKPFPDQSIADAFIGYALLPMQYDMRFESNLDLGLRARIMYLVVLSARHQNLFAVSHLDALCCENQAEENAIDEKIYKLIQKAEELQACTQQLPLHYRGRDLFEKLEFEKSQAFFSSASEAGDIRGTYNYYYYAFPEASTLNECTDAQFRAVHKEGWYHLLIAETTHDMAIKKRSLEAAARFGEGYAYYQLGGLLLHVDKNINEALCNYCLAFEKGYYEAHRKIYEVCVRLGVEWDDFGKAYKDLCDTFIGEAIDDEQYQKLVCEVLK